MPRPTQVDAPLTPEESPFGGDFARFARKPAFAAEVMGIRVLIADNGNPKPFLDFAAERSREAAVALIKEYVREPNLELVQVPISTWSTSALVGFAGGLAEKLGMKDFL